MIKIKNVTSRSKRWGINEYEPNVEETLCKEDFERLSISVDFLDAILKKEAIVIKDDKELKPGVAWRLMKPGDAINGWDIGLEELEDVHDLSELLKHLGRSYQKKLDELDERFGNLKSDKFKKQDLIEHDYRLSSVERELEKDKDSYLSYEKKIQRLESKIDNYFITDEKEPNHVNGVNQKIDSIENKLSEMKTMYREVIRNQKLIIASKDSLQEYVNSPTDDFQYGTMGITSRGPLDFEQGEVNEYILTGGPSNSQLYIEIKLYLDNVLSEEVLVKWTDFNQTFMKIEVDAGLGAAEAAGDNSDSLLSWKFKDFVTQDVKIDLNTIGSCEVRTNFRSKSHDDCKGICPSIGSGALEIKGITFNEVNYN